MENNNYELLFEYLRKILYENDDEIINVTTLEDQYQRLGKGLQFLHRAVREMQTYATDLSQGNLSGGSSWENFLCSNLKTLYANLNHLTWQAKQVAAGDYSQHVSYLGEFSEAFNTMTRQLKEREEQLRAEAAKMQKRAEVIEEYNELLIAMMQKWNEWVIVIDTDNGNVVYCNKCPQGAIPGRDLSGDPCFEHAPFHVKALQSVRHLKQKSWELQGKQGQVLQVNSFSVEWHGRHSYVHMVADVTQEKQEAEDLAVKAYHDPGTGIYNRLYFEEYMSCALENKYDLTLCYMDLDGLKFVNDHFGHNEGDKYISSFVAVIQKLFRSDDVFCRIGGDEFCLVIRECHQDAVKRKMAIALERFASMHKKHYAAGFSYGVIEIVGRLNTLSLEELIRCVDAEMYQCKQRNKERYRK